MKFPQPSFSLTGGERRVIGAAVLGLALPVLIGAIVALLAYYPLGSALPRFAYLNVVGLALAIVGTAAMILMAATVWSLATWNWRPVAYSVLTIVGILVGIVPGFWTHSTLRHYALQLFVPRGMELVNAINKFEQMQARLPTTIVELVPRFLPRMPTTGMATYPVYRYEPKPGPCSAQNKWHLLVPTQEFLAIAYLLYCPRQDYSQAKLNDPPEPMGSWGYVSYYP